LVDLNTRRAAEEASGTVRWLRPEFQNPSSANAQAAIGMAEQAEAEDDEAETSTTAPVISVVQQAWPATLPEQIKAVADILTNAPTPLDLDAIAAHFKARGRWRERLPTILDTLVAIGRVRSVENTSWSGV
jgi:hypothetical protein